MKLLFGLALFVALALQGSRSEALSGAVERCGVETKYEFYDVEGASLEQLSAALRQRGPRDEHGKGRFAYTDWGIKWAWRKTGELGVDLDSVKLECKATILLPRLKPATTLSAESIQAWHAFVERTREHELSHLRHVELGAPRIIRALADERRRSGVLTTSRANQIAKGVVAEIREMDRRYDARTDHGRLEGTWSLQPVG